MIYQGVIQFDDIYFVYFEGVYVFDWFSLKIVVGEKVGIVGFSGFGKLIIVMLL